KTPGLGSDATAFRALQWRLRSDSRRRSRTICHFSRQLRTATSHEVVTRAASGRANPIPPPGCPPTEGGAVNAYHSPPRLVELYPAGGRPDEAEEWRAKRKEYPPEQAPPPRPGRSGPPRGARNPPRAHPEPPPARPHLTPPG